MAEITEFSKLEGLPVEDYSCLQSYVNDGCLINEQIRNMCLNTDTYTTCCDINNLFKNITLNRDLTLYRGVTDRDHLCHPGYTSTSLDFIIARDFIGRQGVILHITISKGQQIRAIKIVSNKVSEDSNKVTGFENENEILFPCNTCFVHDDAPENVSSFPYVLNNGNYVWSKNPEISIIFVKLAHAAHAADVAFAAVASGGGKKYKYIRLNSKIYRVIEASNHPFIIMNGKKVLLSSIRRRYRYVTAF